jgi:hypothetical protein
MPSLRSEMVKAVTPDTHFTVDCPDVRDEGQAGRRFMQI